MPTTVQSSPVPPEVVARDIFGFLEAVVTSCTPEPTYAVERLSLFESIVDNSTHDVFVYVIQLCADLVSVDFDNVYVVFLSATLFST